MAKNTTTRWDALSMRDRASLIKLYSQSGIRKLDDMKAHYNRFDMGGDKDNNLYFNPDYSSNNPQYKVAPTVEPLHVEQPYTPDDFFERWYPNRMRQIQNNLAVTNRLKDRLFPNKIAGKDARPFVNSMLRNAKLVKEYTLLHPGNYDSEKNFMFPNALKDSVARNMLNDSVRAKNRILGKEIMEDYPDDDLRWEAYGTYGFSKPSYPHHIFYTTAKPSENTIVHERTHPLRPELGSKLSERYMTYPLFTGEALNPMELKINSLIAHDQLRMSEKGEKLNSKDARYYFSPEELNARMNAIREQQNINPKHTITKEDLQEIKEKASYKDREGFLDILDDDSLLRLFNDVASTNEKVDMSNIAANGGSIHNNRFDTGGDKKPWYQTVLNSLSSARDARIGAVGAQQVRDLYSSGDKELADDLAKKYTMANSIGIAGGAVTGIGAGSLGTGLAKGIGWFGNTAMPSSLLKGAAYYLPDVAAEAAAMSPYLDAAALTAWTGIGYNSAKNRWKSGDRTGAIAEGAISSLPLFAVAPTAINEAKNATRGFFRVMPDNMVSSGAPAEKGFVISEPEFGHPTASIEAILEESANRQNELQIFNNKALGLLAKNGDEAAAAALASRPYEIESLGGGYMLKSLMRDNPLEKQLSKQGTVNVNNIRALAGKGSKVEQAIIDKVLASEEFAGKKSIDYNQFRKAVQDELITYNRTPDERWADYGMDSLFPDPAGGGAGWYGFATPETFTFSSSRIPTGSGKHYHGNTLGHSRTYTTADEPDVLHVMESQSDWAQQAKRGKIIKDAEKAALQYKKDIDRANALFEENVDIEDKLTRGIRPDGTNIEYDYEYRDIREIIERNEQTRNSLLTRAKKYDMAAHPDKYVQESYLQDNYTSRQIQENLRYAAEKGQTKMRYPTRETAAKIEGYPEVEMYIDERGIKHDTPYEYDQDIKAKLDAVQRRFDEISRSTNESDMPEYERLAKELSELSDAYTNSAVPIKNAKKVISYANEHEGILRKYDAFPKQYQKLFKGADVRTVTDAKGNTWYEVDVPEDYLHQEWQYANGGSIHINPKNRGKFNALLKRTGKSASWFKEHGTPLQRKRATFALNARKWKHPDGGEINVLGNPNYNKAQEEYMYRYLKDSGMDDTHVAAIMGNIAVESGLNAVQKQIKGPAWGLIQAEGSRQEAIKNYNDVPYLFGSKLSPEEQRQLDYIIEKGIRTYTPGEWGMEGFKGARQARKGFINETDLTKATDIFMRNYERPSKQHRSWRQNMSKYYYDKYKEPEYYVPLDFFNK